VIGEPDAVRERSLDADASGERDAYLRYSALTVPMIKARGGTALWTETQDGFALGPQPGNGMGYLALVCISDVAALVDMMNRPDYETAAIRIAATVAWSMSS